DVGLHFAIAEAAIKREVAGDFFGRVSGEVATGKAFEEACDFLLRDAASKSCHLRQDGRFVRSVEAVAVEAAAEIVGGGGEEMPKHLRFPGRECFGVDGMNVGVGEQREAL